MTKNLTGKNFQLIWLSRITGEWGQMILADAQVCVFRYEFTFIQTRFSSQGLRRLFGHKAPVPAIEPLRMETHIPLYWRNSEELLRSRFWSIGGTTRRSHAVWCSTFLCKVESDKCVEHAWQLIMILEKI